MKNYLLCALFVLTSNAWAESERPLFDAINSNDLTQVKQLLKSGVNVNKRYPDYMNASPLMVAMSKNNPELTKMLLQAGAEIDAVDENGDPAINWAAYYGLTDQVGLLLKNNASTELIGHGNTLDIAMRRGHEELVLLLVKHSGTVEKLSPPNMRLQNAIDEKDLNAAQSAIEAGADAQGMDDTGRPMIARAARRGQSAFISLLKDHGAQIDAADRIGFTPLMEAVRVGDAGISALLLKEGANPDHAAMKRGLLFTPMHQAAVSGSSEVLALLLTTGAKLDPLDSMGNTPAMWALFEGNIDLCLRFLDAGSNPDLINESDVSLNSAARQYDVKKLVVWLDENGFGSTR